MNDITELLAGIDVATPEQPFASGALETGWYTLRVASVERSETKTAKIPQARMRLQVTGGPSKGRSAFINMNLNASKYENVEGGQRELSDVEYSAKKQKFMNRMRAWKNALGITSWGAAVGDGNEAYFNAFAVESWVGREFAGKIRLEAERQVNGRTYGEQNSLSEYYALNDPKRGEAYVRGLEAKGGTAGGVATRM